MRGFKAILFILIGFFLAYQSVSMIQAILVNSKSNDFSAIEQIFIAIFLLLCVTGAFAFPGFVMPTSRLLPAQYYEINRANSLGMAYKILNVKYFKNIIIWFYWGRGKNKKRYFDGTKAGLQNLLYQSKQSEFGHLLPFLLLLLISIILIINGIWLAFLIVFIINIIGNAYPIILQRHHRLRINHLIKKN